MDEKLKLEYFCKLPQLHPLAIKAHTDWSRFCFLTVEAAEDLTELTSLLPTTYLLT